MQALELCLKELSTADREMMQMRYHGRTGTEALLEQFGGSRRTLFRNLDRIRRVLLDCINRRVAAADFS